MAKRSPDGTAEALSGGKFPVLGLPAEIRNIIYRFIMPTGQNMPVLNLSNGPVVRPGPSGQIHWSSRTLLSSRGVIALLSTSRQTYKEAFRILYEENPFTFYFLRPQDYEFLHDGNYIPFGSGWENFKLIRDLTIRLGPLEAFPSVDSFPTLFAILISSKCTFSRLTLLYTSRDDETDIGPYDESDEHLLQYFKAGEPVKSILLVDVQQELCLTFRSLYKHDTESFAWFRSHVLQTASGKGWTPRELPAPGDPWPDRGYSLRPQHPST